MTLDEMKAQAKAEVEVRNPNSTNLAFSDVYENFLDGTLISITFQTAEGKDAINHVHFADQVRVYRIFHDVCNAVSSYKERRWFFRFLEFAGIGGLIAFTLILVFSLMLFFLALSDTAASSPVLEVVKLSFTTILGYFFGSQTTKR